MANGFATMDKAEQMYPEQLWDACEHMDRLADSQAHHRLHIIPPARKVKR